MLLLCWKVAPSGLYLLDLSTYKTVLLTTQQYFLYQHKIEILPFNKFKSTWEVMDCEPFKRKVSQNATIGTIGNMLENKLTRLTVRPLETGQPSDLLIEVRCHLGEFEAGDEVEAIDLRHLNYYEWMNMNQFKGVDDVVVIRKKRQQKKEERIRVKRMEMDDKNETGKRKKKLEKEERDFEEFLEEVEADPDMRKMVVEISKEEDVMERIGGKEE